MASKGIPLGYYGNLAPYHATALSNLVEKLDEQLPQTNLTEMEVRFCRVLFEMKYVLLLAKATGRYKRMVIAPHVCMTKIQRHSTIFLYKPSHA